MYTIFAGKKNFLWDETDEGIRFEVPADVFCGKDPGDGGGRPLEIPGHDDPHAGGQHRRVETDTAAARAGCCGIF